MDACYYDLGGDLFVQVGVKKPKSKNKPHIAIKKATRSASVKGGQRVRAKALVCLSDDQFGALVKMKKRILTDVRQQCFGKDTSATSPPVSPTGEKKQQPSQKTSQKQKMIRQTPIATGLTPPPPPPTTSNTAKNKELTHNLPLLEGEIMMTSSTDPWSQQIPKQVAACPSSSSGLPDASIGGGGQGFDLLAFSNPHHCSPAANELMPGQGSGGHVMEEAVTCVGMLGPIPSPPPPPPSDNHHERLWTELKAELFGEETFKTPSKTVMTKRKTMNKAKTNPATTGSCGESAHSSLKCQCPCCIFKRR